MGEQGNAEAAQTLFAAWERWDLDVVESLLDDDAIDRRPQSGERFVGRSNIVGMYREVPGPPEITWQAVRGGADVWVAEGIVEYGEGPVHLIGVVEFADGKVTSANYYFANPFAPPASRSRWASAHGPSTAIHGRSPMAATVPAGIHREFERAFNAGDLGALVDLYEPDAALIAQPGTVSRGREEIVTALQAFLDLGDTISLETKEVVEVGELAFLVNRWTLTGTGPDGGALNMGALTAEVARQQPDGTWLYVIDNAWGDLAVGE